MLHSEQRNFVDEVLASPRGCYLLKGGAGTGKTHTVSQLIRELKGIEPNLNVVMTAPTTTAVKVLKDFIEEDSTFTDFIEACTIHSLLELIVKNKGGSTILEKNKNYKKRTARILQYDVIIVDETSMIGRDLWYKYLKPEISRIPNALVIFMGDKEQFKPVKDGDFSPIFEEINKVFTLHTPQRTNKDNPARSLIDKYREAALSSKMFITKATNLNKDFDGYVTLDQDKWLELLVARVKEGLDKDDPDYCKAIAYTNRRVNDINTFIRTKIYGENAPQFVDNEYVVANSAIVGEDQNVVIENNREFKVNLLKEDICEYTKLPVIWVESEIYGQPLKVIDYKALPLQEQFFTNMRKACRDVPSMWEDYWTYYYSFADIRYLHAKTGHKSQGSTVNHVFVDQDNLKTIRDPEDRARAAYVAVSRMRNCVYFY